jgi:hypothetical protein
VKERDPSRKDCEGESKVGLMDTETGRRDYTQALRRAHEERDVDLALGLYDEHARDENP